MLKKILLPVSFSVLLFSGCGADSTTTVTQTAPAPPPTVIEPPPETETEVKTETETQTEVVKVPDQEEKLPQDQELKQQLRQVYIGAKATIDNNNEFPGPDKVLKAVFDSEPHLDIDRSLIEQNEVNEAVPDEGEIMVVGDMTGGNDLCLIGRSRSGSLFDLEAHANNRPVSEKTGLVAKAQEQLMTDKICDGLAD